MRTLLEETDLPMVLLDGVKVLYDDGWVLALPDPQEPLTHLWAEAGSDAEAEKRAQEYAERITRMIGVR